MNLVPVDTAAVVPGVVEPEAKPGADFAALMTGLMAGDTQIAPVLDLPVPENAPEAPIETDVLGEPGTILQLVGTPPTGVTFSRSKISVDSDLGADLDSSDEIDAELAAGAPGLVSPTLTGSAPLVGNPTEVEPITQVESTAVDAQEATLASVHSISSAAPAAPDAPLEPVEAAPVNPTVANVQGTASDSETTTTTRSTPDSPTRMENELGHREVTDRPQLAGMSARDTADEPAGSPAADHRIDGVEVETLEPVARNGSHDLDPGSWLRSIEPTRGPVSMSQGPVMVGVARRVEEAIAALANKPDPKIVTLQLDELDGVRLTVALRADGIHLSSNGDASLASEIERALAGRGFDMASDPQRQRHRDTAQNSTDDTWSPQVANRRPKADPTGITL
jgi:hypothetical protein